MYLHCDYETQSAVDLRKTGVEVYAQDPTTSVLCMSYCFDDGEVKIWKRGEELPAEVYDHVVSGGKVVCHNFAFEFNIWNKHCTFILGWPELKQEQGYCTMSMAYAMSLPGSLDGASKSLGITAEKDLKGSRVMMQLAKPRGQEANGTPIFYEYEDAPDKFESLYKYCIQDTVVERELHKRLVGLSPNERKVWLLDQEINQRGVLVDIKSIDVCNDIVDSEKIRLNKAMKEATDYRVNTCTANGQLLDYLKWHDIDINSVAKPIVIKLLERPDIPEKIKHILRLRQEASQTSVAKLAAMKRGACYDHRVRGLFQYHGSHTGRWAGRRVQLQNLKRPDLKQGDIDDVFKSLKKDKTVPKKYGQALDVISDCVRGFLVPKKGHDFIGCDFNAVEARVLAWLSGEEKVLEVFRGHGKIYESAASDIYHVPLNEVTKAQRQIGKTAILALGYGGGKVAFKSMAANFGLDISEDKAEEIKVAWREENPHIVRYWYAAEDCVLSAVANPGKKYKVGAEGRECYFLVNGSFLWCQLPSGRVICFPYPKIESVTTPWGDPKQGVTYMALNLANKWVRTKTYGGKLVENITQAVSRCLLSESLFRLEEKGYPVVMHIHDEAVVEVPRSYGSVSEVETIMSIPPKWAQGLPLKSEGWRGERFRK